MTRLPVGPRDVLALTRHVRVSAARGRPLLVTGVLADQLARQLGAGADPGAVRTAGEPGHVGALVHIVGGALTPEDERVLRAATRALVPLVVVQTGDTDTRLPYVLPTDVVTCEPGKGFPIDEIARTLATALGSDGPALARAVPILRDPVEAGRAQAGALTAAALAATGGDVPKLPALALAQTRMLAEIQVAEGAPLPEATQEAAQAIGPQLAAALGTGYAARELVRRSPRRNRLLEAGVAGAATYALATVFRRLARR